MDDTRGVGGFKSIGNLDAVIEEFLQGKGLAVDTLLERLAVQQFHDDDGLVLELLDLVDRADVGMIQSRRGAGLALEAV
jgi:hypothetical protein